MRDSASLKRRRQRPVKASTTTASLALGAGFLVVLVQLLVVLFVEGTPLLLHVLLASVVVGTTAFLGDEHGRFDIRQPWSVLMVFHVPFWIIGSFKTVLDPEQRVGWLAGSEAQIPLAFLMVSVGFIAIATGYRFGVTLLCVEREPRQSAQAWNCSRLILVSIATYLIVVPVRYYLYNEFLARSFSEALAVGAPPTFVRTFDTVAPRFLLLVVWAAFYLNSTHRYLLWLGIALTAAEMTWALIVGTSKSAFFLPVFLPVIPYVILKAKIPVTRLAISAGVLLLIAYPYVNGMRAVYFQADGPRRADARQAAFLHGWFWSSPTREGLELFANQALDRVGGIGSVCQLLQLDKDGELDIGGAFYYRAIIGLVPRVLWPEKPIIHEGVYFSAYLQGFRDLDTIDPSTISGSVALTLFGSFYWNFGWLGVVLTSLALGAFSGLAYSHLKAKGLTNPAGFFYYTAILAVLETTETEVVKFPSSLAWGLALAWCASRLVGTSAASSERAEIGRYRRRAGHRLRRLRVARQTDGGRDGSVCKSGVPANVQPLRGTKSPTEAPPQTL